MSFIILYTIQHCSGLFAFVLSLRSESAMRGPLKATVRTQKEFCERSFYNTQKKN